MQRPPFLAAIVAFVAFDIVLAFVVFQHVNRTPPKSDLPAAATASPTRSSGNSDQQPFEFDPAEASSIDVANDGTMIFATRGQCDGKASAEVRVSANGGKRITTPNPGFKEVLTVQAGAGGNLVVVGAAADCVAKQVSSTDAGATWTPAAAITIWYPSPGDTKQTVSPKRSSKPGCTVTSLSQVGDDFARVTCSDGKIRGTGNGGSNWVTLGRLDNVRVASFSTFTKGYALARYQGCAAQTFVTSDSGRTWKRGGCITGDPARAIGSSDVRLVAVVGSTSDFYASTDSGVEWAQP